MGLAHNFNLENKLNNKLKTIKLLSFTQVEIRLITPLFSVGQRNHPRRVGKPPIPMTQIPIEKLELRERYLA